MLMTLAGGFVPFVVRFVLNPAVSAADLSSYTLDGKMLELIRVYSEGWPAYDLELRAAQTAGEEEDRDGLKD